jgi:OmpA-OmpF porin, OOP family
MKSRRGRKQNGRNLGAVAGLVALAGCTSNIDKLKQAPTSGSAFQEALTNDYKAYVANQVAQDNWHYANYFADKGLAASRGAAVPPEVVSKWNIPSDKKQTMDDYRKRLLAALDGGARNDRPVNAAHAQVSFDCWLQKLEENNITETHAWIAGSDTVTATPDEYAVATCKSDFLAQLAKAEGK